MNHLQNGFKTKTLLSQQETKIYTSGKNINMTLSDLLWHETHTREHGTLTLHYSKEKRSTVKEKSTLFDMTANCYGKPLRTSQLLQLNQKKNYDKVVFNNNQIPNEKTADKLNLTFFYYI